MSKYQLHGWWMYLFIGTVCCTRTLLFLNLLFSPWSNYTREAPPLTKTRAVNQYVCCQKINRGRQINRFSIFISNIMGPCFESRFSDHCCGVRFCLRIRICHANTWMDTLHTVKREKHYCKKCVKNKRNSGIVILWRQLSLI